MGRYILENVFSGLEVKVYAASMRVAASVIRMAFD
jgi:hypothetical protein